MMSNSDHGEFFRFGVVCDLSAFEVFADYGDVYVFGVDLSGIVCFVKCCFLNLCFRLFPSPCLLNCYVVYCICGSCDVCGWRCLLWVVCVFCHVKDMYWRLVYT